MDSIIGTASISTQLRLKNESLGGLNPQKAGHACTKKKSVVIRAVKTPTQLQQRSPASTGSVKHAMTMTEKILGRAAEKSTVSPGENVWVNVDTLMTHDVTGPGTIGIFKREFGPQAKVWDREKIVIIPDHYIFTNDELANRNVDIIRDFAQEQNIKYFYDIKDRSNFKVAAALEISRDRFMTLMREGQLLIHKEDIISCQYFSVHKDMLRQRELDNLNQFIRDLHLEDRRLPGPNTHS